MSTIITQGDPLKYEGDDSAILLREGAEADKMIPEITKLLDNEGRFTPTWPILPEMAV